MTEINPYTGRVQDGDGNRPAEFREAREQLVSEVNGWLLGLVSMRDAAKPLQGVIIGSRPLIVAQEINNNDGSPPILEERMSSGTSIMGDGVISPLKLEVVRTHNDGNAAEAIIVSGSDPVAEHYYEGVSSHYRAKELRAAFILRGFEDSKEHNCKYGVFGDGAVRRDYQTLDGVSFAESLGKPDDIALAMRAFRKITLRLA